MYFDDKDSLLTPLLLNTCAAFAIYLKPLISILGNSGLQWGWEGNGETESGKKVGGREGKGKGKGKPWEASLHRSFLDQLLF